MINYEKFKKKLIAYVTINIEIIFSMIKKFNKKHSSEKKRKNSCYMFGMIMLIFSLAIICMLIKDFLKNAGISFNLAYGIFIFMTLIALFSSLIFLREKDKKINGYFIFAVIVSTLVLLIGLYFFQMLYFIDNLATSPYIRNPDDYKQFNENNLMKNLVPPHCFNLMNSEYLTEYDVLNCNLSFNSETEFLEKINIFREVINGSSTVSEEYCKDNFCNFNLYLGDDSKKFNIVPIFIEENKILEPVVYIFKIDFLYNKQDLKQMEIERFTLLLTIITMSFISVWAGVYYAKRILEDK